jgi:hypothetical protein
MATKLFKIGESAYYGKWRITIKSDKVICTGIDYFDNVVMEEETFDVKPGFMTERNLLPLLKYLESVSTFYWAEKMVDWIESKLKGKKYA